MSERWNDSVRALNGVGEKKAAMLAKLGIHTLGDLAEFYPRRYLDRRRIWDIMDAPDGEEVCVCAVVSRAVQTDYPRRGLTISRTAAFDETGALSLTFFNRPFGAQRLQVGSSYIFCGKIETVGRRRSMTNPLFEEEGAGAISGRIVPVYPLTAGLSAGQLSGWVAQALTRLDAISDDLPTSVRQEHRLAQRDWAVRTLHAPDSFEALEQAKERLIFEELFYLTAGLELLHTRRSAADGCRFAAREVAEFTTMLPFCLTSAQQRVMVALFADLASGRVMNRLLQGDVGSGKTVVAAGAVWLAARSGWQSALMAPTELLAHQHYRTLSTLLCEAGVRVGLLTAGMPAGEKRRVREQLADGTLDFVVGTHALLSESVAFSRLGLVITDEQHRFGVGQRAALSAKGGAQAPHVLVMSATPIPRTLALIIYGDLDVSVIDELPPGRTPVETLLIGEDKRTRLQGFIRRQAEQGHQTYIVCPAVEESEQGTAAMKNVTDYARQLRAALPELRIESVHGRLSAQEKQRVMGDFAAGQADVLVSTTVIEVGVDVPNATLMVIEDADRFGLSQLHQLRGRVGRGGAKSYCVLISSSHREETRARLRALCETNDGFVIAEKDLQQRGPGDFFGARQSGLPQLHVASLAGDTRLLYRAREAAQRLLAEDPALERAENRPVMERIRRLFHENPDIFN